jgi:HEAT repeat protein
LFHCSEQTAVILSPEEYPSISTYDLLRAAALGRVAFDHRLLRAIVGRGEAALPDMLRFSREEREDDRIGTDSEMLAMVRHLRTPAALPILVEYARRHREDFPHELMQAFGELGSASVEPLVELYREPEIASEAAFALAALGVRDPRILDVLVKELEAEPFQGAMCLRMYGDPAAIPDLEKALAKAEDDFERREISGAIEELTSGASEPSEAQEPFNIWESFPERDEPIFAALDDEELVEFLRSPVAEYRAHAARLLGQGELPAEVVGGLLEVAAADPDVRVRADAWEALKNAADDPEVGGAMRSRLADLSAPPEEQAAIAVALAAEFGREEPLHSAILELYAIPEARARAIKAMWHSFDRRFAELIPRHLADPDPEVRNQAVLAVGWLGIVSQIGRVQSLFGDEGLRDSALYAYALAAPGDESRAGVRRLFRKIEVLAGGLTEDEALLVRKALDDRLQLRGQKPIFGTPEIWGQPEMDKEEPEPLVQAQPKVGRNEPCPCGSGKKYKKCCGQ